jgi:hypothetical protein
MWRKIHKNLKINADALNRRRRRLCVRRTVYHMYQCQCRQSAGKYACVCGICNVKYKSENETHRNDWTSKNSYLVCLTVAVCVCVCVCVGGGGSREGLLRYGLNHVEVTVPLREGRLFFASSGFAILAYMNCFPVHGASPLLPPNWCIRFSCPDTGYGDPGQCFTGLWLICQDATAWCPDGVPWPWCQWNDVCLMENCTSRDP